MTFVRLSDRVLLWLARYASNTLALCIISPPGEMKKRNLTTSNKNQTNKFDTEIDSLSIPGSGKNARSVAGRFIKKTYSPVLMGISSALIIILIGYILISKGITPKKGQNTLPAGKSIIVMPFKYLSNDPGNQWFAEGVTEDIRNNLCRISELFVISKTTSEYLSGKAMTIPEIARKLNVSYVLEGSVLRDGNMVRVFVQLIDAGNDRHMFSERFENEMVNIFAVHSDIAKKVADELEVVITPGEIGQIEEISTKSTEAYGYYLHGRYLLNKRTGEDFTKSISYFEKAIASDPGYALAWAGLADAYYLLTWWEQYPKPDGFIKSKEYALKALELDRNLAEAHTVLGGLLTYNDWDWEEARKELQIAVEINPNFASGHSYYAELLSILGENKEARKQINIALELDPLFYLFHYHSGGYYFSEERYKEALVEYQKSIELEPLSNPYTTMFICYQVLGDKANSIKVLNDWLKREDYDVPDPDFFANIYNRSGEKGIWNRMLELQLKESSPSLWGLAYNYLKAGNKDKALDMLERCLVEKSVHLPLINNTPDFDIIRKEQRFQAIIKKMGLSEYQKRLAEN